VQENKRIGFRISPELERHERYNYLLSRLTPKPRKPSSRHAGEKNIEAPPSLPQATARQGGEHVKAVVMASSSKKQKTPASTATPMEGVEESHHTTSPNHEEETGATNVAPGQGATLHVLPSLVSLAGVEQDKEKEMTEKNLAPCGTLAVRPGMESSDGWQPPEVTHEFGYPSDEEIVPNPKADFKKAFLPRLGHVRSWFKGGETESRPTTSTSQDGARSIAPCLPIMMGKGSLSEGDPGYHPDISPRCYTNINSRLPQNSNKILQMASRPGAKTWLKSVALRSVTDGLAREEGLDDYIDDEGSLSDSSSSSSLEKLPNSHPYHVLAPSVPSDCEDGLEDLHTAPARMEVDGGKGDKASMAVA